MHFFLHTNIMRPWWKKEVTSHYMHVFLLTNICDLPPVYIGEFHFHMQLNLSKRYDQQWWHLHVVEMLLPFPFLFDIFLSIFGLRLKSGCFSIIGINLLELIKVKLCGLTYQRWFDMVSLLAITLRVPQFKSITFAFWWQSCPVGADATCGSHFRDYSLCLSVQIISISTNWPLEKKKNNHCDNSCNCFYSLMKMLSLLLV